MARVTVEDCLEHVENRFKLVMISTQRARQLARGSRDALLPWENDKPTVAALREIATGNAIDIKREHAVVVDCGDMHPSRFVRQDRGPDRGHEDEAEVWPRVQRLPPLPVLPSTVLAEGVGAERRQRSGGGR